MQLRLLAAQCSVGHIFSWKPCSDLAVILGGNEKGFVVMISVRLLGLVIRLQTLDTCVSIMGMGTRKCCTGVTCDCIAQASSLLVVLKPTVQR